MASLASAGLIWPSAFNSLGPFEVSGNLYALGIAVSDITVYKSINNGIDWTEQDSSNRVVNGGFWIDAILFNNIIYVAYATGGNPFTIQVRKFNPSTDTWSSLDTGMTTSPPQISNLTPHISFTFSPIHLVVRADANYIILHQTATQMNMGVDFRTVGYSRFVSGTWTNDVSVFNGSASSIHGDCRAILKGNETDDYVHFFYTKSSGGLYCKTLDNTTLGSEVTVDSSVLHTSNYTVGLLRYNFDGTFEWLILIYVDSNGDLRYVQSLDHASTTNWSSSAAIITSTHRPENTVSNPGVIVIDGSIVYAIWPDDSTNDLWLNSRSGGSWGTDEEIIDAVNVIGVSANLITNAIGVLYSNSNVVTFFSYSLVSGVVVDIDVDTAAEISLLKQLDVSTQAELSIVVQLNVSTQAILSDAKSLDSSSEASIGLIVKYEVIGFRFYNNDGDEANSTPIEAENVGLNLNLNSDFDTHLRYLVRNTGALAGSGVEDFLFQYRVNSGTWTALASGTEVIVHGSSFITDNEATTNRATNGLTDPGGSFVAGLADDGNGNLFNLALPIGDFTELLFSIRLVAAELNGGDVVEFRLINAGDYDLYNTVTAQVSVTSNIILSITTEAEISSQLDLDVNSNAALIVSLISLSVNMEASIGSFGEIEIQSSAAIQSPKPVISSVVPDPFERNEIGVVMTGNHFGT